MAQIFFPEIETRVPASCPPHPQNTCYRIAIGKEDWGNEKKEVLKIQMEYDGSVAGRKSPSFPVESNDFTNVLNKTNELIKEWNLKNTDKITLKMDMYSGSGRLRQTKNIEFFGKEIYSEIVNVYSNFCPETGYPQGFSSDYLFYENTGAIPDDKYYHKYTFYQTKKNNIVVYTEFYHYTANYQFDDKDYKDNDYFEYDTASDVKSFSSLKELLEEITDISDLGVVTLNSIFNTIETEFWDI